MNWQQKHLIWVHKEYPDSVPNNTQTQILGFTTVSELFYEGFVLSEKDLNWIYCKQLRDENKKI